MILWFLGILTRVSQVSNFFSFIFFYFFMLYLLPGIICSAFTLAYVYVSFYFQNTSPNFSSIPLTDVIFVFFYHLFLLWSILHIPLSLIFHTTTYIVSSLSLKEWRNFLLHCLKIKLISLIYYVLCNTNSNWTFLGLNFYGNLMHITCSMGLLFLPFK